MRAVRSVDAGGLPALTAPRAAGDNANECGQTLRKAMRLIERSLSFSQRGPTRVILIDGSGDVPEVVRGAIITVGNFDGVHRGHQRLLARLRQGRCCRSAGAGDHFRSPPGRALAARGGACASGLARAGNQPPRGSRAFDGRRVPHREVAARIDRARILRPHPPRTARCRGMVEGPNFAFGHDRTGDVHTLGAWCRVAGIDFEVVDLAVIDGKLISSSLIRDCLRQGDVASAAGYMGRPHRIRGTVTRGAGRGATIGFPTINLTGTDTLVPGEGVYAVLARIEGDERPHAAACNIGPNPTFGDLAKKIEAHLIGFSGDLYGKSVELDFLERLRPTRKFAGARSCWHRSRSMSKKPSGSVDRPCEAILAYALGRRS